MDDLQQRLKALKDQELSEMKQKYERMIDEMKRNSMSDREFIQRELHKRIDELERQIKDMKDLFESEKEALENKRENMKGEYERQLIEQR